MLEVRTVNGNRVGTIERAPEGAGLLTSTGLGGDLVASWRRRAVDDNDIYELLSGWSNGYVSAVEIGGQPVAARSFNPAEPRIPGGPHGGEWGHGGVVKDVLKLAGKIELGDGEELLGQYTGLTTKGGS